MRLYYCKGGRWAGTQADARTIDTEFEQVEVPIDKPGLLRWLNMNAVQQGIHKAEGLEAPAGERGNEAPTPSAAAPHPIRVEPDDTFNDLPLPQQLHLACLALENARGHIGRNKA